MKLDVYIPKLCDEMRIKEGKDKVLREMKSLQRVEDFIAQYFNACVTNAKIEKEKNTKI